MTAPRRPAARALVGLALAAGAAAAGAHVWARHVEIHRYRVRRVDVPVLPAGAEPVRLLHISDIHLVPTDRRKLRFLSTLAALEPGLVVDTGDNIADARAIGPLARVLDPLLRVPGAFVMGSNDMYAPSPKNPLRYFLPDPRPEGYTTTSRPLDLPTGELAGALAAHGWVDLTNRRGTSTAGPVTVRWVGVDDPHLERDEMPAPEGSAGTLSLSPADGPEVRIGVAHAPYRRVLDAFVRDGVDLILAGHTHGGQLRVPGFGALVTNCDLPRSQARGLSSWDGVPLHVSGGLGASPYSNYRFANPPEATLLTLTPRRV